jgi:hypothetical protein
MGRNAFQARRTTYKDHGINVTRGQLRWTREITTPLLLNNC